MRPDPATGGRSHTALSGVTADQHHPQPDLYTINNTSQSLPPGTQYDLDITLSHSTFKVARIILMGPANSGGGTGTQWKECALVHATTDSTEAIGTSVRSSGSFKKVYDATYSKQNGDANLTHKIFDSSTAVGNRYIALKDAWITGSTLRLRFHNYHGGSATLWVKGSAQCY